MAVTVNVRVPSFNPVAGVKLRAARVSRGDAKQSVAIIDTDHATRFGSAVQSGAVIIGYLTISEISCYPARYVIHHGRQDRRLRRGGIDCQGEGRTVRAAVSGGIGGDGGDDVRSAC